MCHQVVCLVGGALEQHGVVTASISMLPEITANVGASRALAVPYPLGYPLGQALKPEIQLRVLRSLLALVEGATQPTLAELEN